MKLTIGKGLSVPIEILTQRLAALGASGSGKTYATMKIVEEILGKNGQVIVVDTVGNWWGLRLAANGKGQGLSIPILGGERADAPLKPSQGKLTAEMAVRTRASMVLDVSDFTESELYEFAKAFATAFLRAKKRSPSPVLIVWEECQEIVPEVPKAKEGFRTRQEVVRLVKRGRNYGVGTFLISQRSAAVSKEVLSQAETLFAFRTGDARDRKAIAEWLTDKARAKVDLVDELPELPTGTCYVYSPAWLQRFDRVTLSRRWTFDSSATPDFSDFKEAGALKPIDLSRFQKDLGETIERARVEDPAYLKNQIAQLKRELELQLAETRRVMKAKEVSRPVVKDTDLRRFEAAVQKFVKAQERATDSFKVALDLLTQFRRQVADQHLTLVMSPSAPRNGVPVAKPTPRAALPKEYQGPSGDTELWNSEIGKQLGRCEREILRALASRDPTALDRTQAATLAGYSPNSSGYANALSNLHTRGLVQKNGRLLAITATGRDVAGPVDRIDNPRDTLLLWQNKLPLQETRMLNALVDFEQGEGMSRERLAEYVNLSVTSSGFANYLSHLNSNGLIQKLPDGRIKAAPMFLGGV